MRLIDADELKKLFKHNLNESLKEIITANILGKIIDNAPAVDLWHYPSRGEFPQNNKWVFVYLNDNTATVGLYCSWAKMKWIDNYENKIYSADIVAWQYIVPPKEEKEVEKHIMQRMK